MNYPAAIRTIRERANMTQGQLAKRAGVSQSTISMAEAGRCGVSLGFVEKIARAMALSPAVIHLTALEPTDLPRGKLGLLVTGQIMTVLSSLWQARLRRTGGL